MTHLVYHIDFLGKKEVYRVVPRFFVLAMNYADNKA